MEKVTIYEIPKCKVVCSEYGMFGDGKLEAFNAWFSKIDRPIFPNDYLYFDSKKELFRWIYIYSEGLETEGFEVEDFEGGLYAVVAGIDNTDTTEVFDTIYAYLKEKELIVDESRYYLGNIPTTEAGFKALGYNQMNYFVPIIK